MHCAKADVPIVSHFETESCGPRNHVLHVGPHPLMGRGAAMRLFFSD